MSDGHLNKCKDCTKKDTKERTDQLASDPEWVESEKKRHRDKYYRLGYKEKHKPSPQKRKKADRRWKEKYPEKIIASGKCTCLSKPGLNIHHWSYNEAHYKDILYLTMEMHNKLHSFLTYDQPKKMYRTKEGVLLDTKDKHLAYYEQIKDAEY
jgi:hypothetical protein